MRDNKLSSHILPIAATMIGVCLTVIGLVKLVENATGKVYIDELLSVNAVGFLISAVFSYVALRSPKEHPYAERIADMVFMVSLGLFTLVTILFAFALA